ncbi:phage tail protein [Puniceibacterium confluentis]|uniref:phage tail protein n=1 Tax=Puniceibacterium confluentis TaxID=1958944 RepID=UPI0011B7BA2B|nr:tail fiber protein [Puniceibacterium confluentis]
MTYLKKAAVTALSVLTLTTGLAGTPHRAEAGTTPYVGDIMIVGFDFCPRDWARADGQLLPIAQYDALFSLLGTTYGGDGRNTFGLPDLRGRVTIGQGTGPGLSTHRQGQVGGVLTRTMTQETMPAHNHLVNVNNEDGDKPGPGGKLLAAAPTGGTGNETIYSTKPYNKTMSDQMIGATGGSIAFSTQDPNLAITHCIALFGIYPSRD